MEIEKKSCSLKKIKNISCGKPKKQNRDKGEDLCSANRSRDLAMPPKFLDPFHFYIIYSDLLIFDDIDKLEESYVSPLTLLFNMKHIVSVDSFKNYLLINFEEKPSYCLTPLEFLLLRLRSLSNQQAYELSKNLENFQRFWATIIEITENSASKQILDSLDANLLMIVHKYYMDFRNKSIEEEHFPEFLENYLASRENKSVFCLIYDLTDKERCMSIIGLFLNNTMKSLISKKEFEYSNCDFLFLNKLQYFTSYSKTLESYTDLKPDDTFEFVIKTKEGMKKMSFQIERWYFNAKKGAKKVFVFFTEIPTQLKPVKETKKKTNKRKFHQMEEKGNTKRNGYEKEWKTLVNLYFGAFSEDGNDRKDK